MQTAILFELRKVKKIGLKLEAKNLRLDLLDGSSVTDEPENVK